MFAGVLVIAVLLSGAPAWSILVRSLPLSPRLIVSVASFTISAAVLVVCTVVLMGDWLPLIYSVRFAAAGVPGCILALVVAMKEPDVIASRRMMLSAFLHLLLWGFYLTLH